MRSSTWISPPFGGGVLESDVRKGEAGDQPGCRQYTFTDEDKKRFANDPEYHLDFRKRIEAEINSLFGMYQQGSDMNNAFRKLVTEEMHRRIGPGHEELKKHIIPKWAPGCRRISPGDGYLEALVKPNVEPVFGGIGKIVPEGIIGEDGKLHKLDILVCATGFNVAFKPAFKVINEEGKSVQEDWGDSVNLYMGVSAPRFPNYYTIVVCPTTSRHLFQALLTRIGTWRDVELRHPPTLDRDDDRILRQDDAKDPARQHPINLRQARSPQRHLRAFRRVPQDHRLQRRVPELVQGWQDQE